MIVKNTACISTLSPDEKKADKNHRNINPVCHRQFISEPLHINKKKEETCISVPSFYWQNIISF
jgi:peptide deformylase